MYEDFTASFTSHYSTNWGFSNDVQRSFFRRGRGRTSVRTPGFFRLKKTMLPKNAFAFYSYERSEPGFTRIGNYDDGSSDSYTDLLKYVTTVDYSLKSAHAGSDYSSLNACFEGLRDMKVNYAQFIAERKQVIDLVASTAKRLADCFIAIKRRDAVGAGRALGLTSKPKRLSGNISKDWLSYQYGWRPLLSDVKGAAEDLAKSALGRPPVLYVKRRKRFNEQQTPRDNITGTVQVDWTIDTVTDQTVGLEFTLTDEMINVVKQTGITDPALLAWELLPYSFVVDWFLPVGNYLQNLRATDGLAFKSGYSTAFSTVKTSSVIQGSTLQGSSGRQVYSGKPISSTVIRVDRKVITTLPSVPLPRFKDPVSLTHALNGMALLTLAFRGENVRQGIPRPRNHSGLGLDTRTNQTLKGLRSLIAQKPSNRKAWGSMGKRLLPPSKGPGIDWY